MRIGATLLMALLLAAFAPGVAFGGASDIDGDGVPDDTDTCPLTANAGAAQCSPPAVGCDADLDGVPDICDNCKAISNANQCDSNGDGFGNVCDHDLTGDGLVTGGDVSNKKGTGFNQNFGATGPACTIDQDFDDTTSPDSVTGGDVSNKKGTGFNQNFGNNLGTGGVCPGGAACFSGMGCAVVPTVTGGCLPERGPFAP